MPPSPTTFTWPDLPRAKLLTLAPPGALRIRFVPAAPPLNSPAIDAAWGELCRANDRLHDGEVLTARLAPSATPVEIDCALGRYMHLTVQHHAAVGDHGIRLLGAKGLITGRDRAGREHVLIARRGTQTRVYGGMWEIGPGGGVEASPQAHEITHAEIAASLVHEAAQEMGLKLAPADCGHVAAIVIDDEAFSLDLIVPIRWPGVVDPRRGLCAAEGCEWEYIDAAWLAIDEVGGFAHQNPAAITPPTLAVWRWKGWAGEAVGS